MRANHKAGPLAHFNETVKTSEQRRNHQHFIPLSQVTQITSYMDVNAFIRRRNVLISKCSHSELFSVLSGLFRQLKLLMRAAAVNVSSPFVPKVI